MGHNFNLSSRELHEAVTSAKNEVKLFDLVDLEKLFKVTKRTLFNWRAKGIINLIDFGGKLYMTPTMLEQAIAQKGGIL